MDVQLVDNETVTEPVDLVEAKYYLQIDQDYASDDETIQTLITTARQRLEQYLNIGFARREVKVYWGGHELELPLSPTGDLVSVKKGADAVTADDYSVIPLPAKRIAINEVNGCAGNWFYSLNGYVEFTPTHSVNTTVYECTYQTGYEVLPKALKQALLAELSHLFNLRGYPVTDLVSPNAAMLASGYSRNLVL